MPKEVNSIKHLIVNTLSKNHDKVIFSHKKGYRTYALTGKELHNKVNKLRIFLRSKNIKKGDKIILLGSDYQNWIGVYFAAIMNGVIAVPLDILTDKRLLSKIHSQVKAKAIFQDKGLASIGIKTYYFDELDDELKDIDGKTVHRSEINQNDVLEIMYTSGTTGEPKGVVLTHENMLAGLNSMIKAIPLILKFRMLNLLPLSHIFGQVAGLFLFMYYNNPVYFIDTIRPRKLIDFIRLRRLNGAIVVPGILETLKHELEGKKVGRELGSQFQIIGVGGASLDPELEMWWKRRVFAVLQGYGLTETSAALSTNKLLRSKTGSVGQILDNVEVKIADDGEILVKGEHVFSGYYKNEEKTKEAFENGWFKTGDIGEMKNGYLYIKDRKKDIIILSGGLKAYPIDVEHVINSIEGVKDSCVIEKDGKVHAVLILTDHFNPSEIIAKANKKLLSHQRINSYSIWPDADFPRTTTKKVKKFLVKEELKEERMPKHSYVNKLFTIINDVLDPSHKITEHSKLVDLGMDSLKRIELISEIEKEFGIEINEVKLNQEAKVSDIEDMLKKEKIHRIKFVTWPMNPFIRILQKVTQKIIWFPIMRIFTKTDYYGLEHLNEAPLPIIVATNHQSYWDPGIVAKRFSFKSAVAAHSDVVFGIGTKNAFLRPLRRFEGFLASMFFNAYPFGETIGTDTSLEFTGEMLDRGYSIGIAPEGTRTPDGKIHEFRPGIGYLAVNMNVPIIPAKIEGLFYVLPAVRMIPRFGKSKVTFGKPIMPKTFKGMSYIEATKLIEKKVREL